MHSVTLRIGYKFYILNEALVWLFMQGRVYYIMKNEPVHYTWNDLHKWQCLTLSPQQPSIPRVCGFLKLSLSLFLSHRCLFPGAKELWFILPKFPFIGCETGKGNHLSQGSNSSSRERCARAGWRPSWAVVPEQFPPQDVEVPRYLSAHEHYYGKREVKTFFTLKLLTGSNLSLH